VLASVEETPTGQLVALGVVAAIGALLLLQAAFGRWGMAAVGLVTLPLALSGGALGALADGGELSLGSLMGFVAVLGIAARNTVTMIVHCQKLELAEGEPFGPGLVVRAARERLTPVLATAVATALAVLPLVVLGGLVTSTLIALLVIPSLYLRFGADLEAAGGLTPQRLATILERRARARQEQPTDTTLPTTDAGP